MGKRDKGHDGKSKKKPKAIKTKPVAATTTTTTGVLGTGGKKK